MGATWDTPLDGLRLRALQSRDVRAPNLAELFAGARVNNGSVTDDFACGNCANPGAAGQTISPLPNPITANPNLKPEKGQTTEMGLVWSPSYIPGLNLSATYWRVGVKGIITQLSQQQEMDLCFNGNALQCSFISSNGVPWATGGVINAAATLTRPTSQITPQVNIASVVTEGIDYEASYRFAMNDAIDWGLGGDITIRLLATNVMKFVTNPGFIGGVIQDVAGNNANGGNATPHWKIFFNQAYDTDNWGLFVNERWFSEGRDQPQLGGLRHRLPRAGGPQPSHGQQQLHAGRTLLRHRRSLRPERAFLALLQGRQCDQPEPRQCECLRAGEPVADPLNPALYDTLGRFYHVGFRILD